LAPVFVVLYILILLAARKNGKKTTDKKHDTKMELRLTIMGLIITVIYIFICILYVCILVFGINDIFSWCFAIAGDLLSVSNPYLLFAFSSAVRKQFYMFLFCGKVQVSVTTMKVTTIKVTTKV
jgi:hypothetical protein